MILFRHVIQSYRMTPVSNQPAVDWNENRQYLCRNVSRCHRAHLICMYLHDIPTDDESMC